MSRARIPSLLPASSPGRRNTAFRKRAARHLGLSLGCLALLWAGCNPDPGGAVDPYPAPEFELQDVNPTSQTYLETLSTQDASGSVLVLYFASFT